MRVNVQTSLALKVTGLGDKKFISFKAFLQNVNLVLDIF
jgi:hypothetical protein